MNIPLSILTEIATEILKANKECALSGGLALYFNGIKTRRPPNDIDIFVPKGIEFIPLPLMKIQDVPHSEFYEDENFYLERYKYKGTQIDVLSYADGSEYHSLKTHHLFTQPFKLVTSLEILSFKMQHALDGETYTRFKHKDDLIHILVNNVM